MKQIHACNVLFHLAQQFVGKKSVTDEQPLPSSLNMVQDQSDELQLD